MTTIAQSYMYMNDGNMTNQNLIAIARNELADLYSNGNCSWVEFCDGSILTLDLGDLKASRKRTKKHINGVTW